MNHILLKYFHPTRNMSHAFQNVLQASIPNVHQNDIHPKYGSSHAKDKRIKEEIEPIYKTDKQGTHVTYTCKPIKRADTRIARDRACKIEPCQKDQGQRDLSVHCTLWTNRKQIFSEVYCLFNMLHCPVKFFDTNQLMLFMTLCVCLLHAEDNTGCPSQL